ncbi:Glycerophosphoryl diester phosphodiesterase [Roseovarius albus]|uniref:Glycerophosphoryl diester phosphodiesterase n=1 Tax=Roseovarius albus TaxID=1247867 RepID=A0A1X6YQW9_9RHOB|nr:glycerophosphodiester phosphodiesterase family protein [Roseovarius albus]SLN28662.1 Glycerophosphoryl diester phosphodiesterase [Roseovarius albus]
MQMKAILHKAWRERRSILMLHILFVALSTAVIFPLCQAVIQLAVSFSGKAALTDQDIAKYLVSPLGFGLLVVVGAIIIAASVLELSGLLIEFRGASSVRAVFARLRQKFVAVCVFAGWLILRVFAVVLPAAGLIAWIVFSQIGDYDINYYLSTHPPEFIRAIVYAAPLVVALVLALLWLLAGWVMALPLILFTECSPRRSFAQSVALTRGRRFQVGLAIAVWAGTSVLVALLSAWLIAVGVQLLAPPVDAGLARVAVLAFLSLLLWGALLLLSGAVSAGVLAAAIDTLSEQIIPRMPAFDADGDRFAGVLLWAMAGFIVVSGAGTGWALLQQARTVEEVVVIAHRGAAGVRPENTLAAMEEGIVQGADWLEIDVQEDAGGEVIVVHDSDFMKLAGNPLKVWNATAEDLADIDIGSWFAPEYAGERVPTLRDVLLLAKGRAKVLVELKYYGHDDQLAERVAEVIEEAGMVDRTAVMSLKTQQVEDIKRVRPEWRRGLLAATAIGDLSQYDADFLAVNSAIASPGFIARAQAAGKDVYVWTPNDAMTMSQMLSRGVDGLITDEPGLAHQVIKARSEMSVVERLLVEVADVVGFASPEKIYRDASP